MSLSETMGLRSVWEEAFHSFPHKSLSVVGRTQCGNLRISLPLIFHNVN